MRHLLIPTLVVALSTLQVASPAAGQTETAQVTLADLRAETFTVVPRCNQWSLIPPGAQPALARAAAVDKSVLDELMSSPDPDELGLATFIADQQGDIARLLSLSHLLSNEALTVPYALPLAQPGEYDRHDQTLSEYLTAVYHDWLGVDVDQSPERFTTLIGKVDHPEHLAYPWIVRLLRSQDDKKQLKSLKDEVADLPDRVRWAVVTVGWCESVYTRQEALAAVLAMGPNLTADIQADRMVLPDEPLFRASESYRRAVYERFLALTRQ